MQNGRRRLNTDRAGRGAALVGLAASSLALLAGGGPSKARTRVTLGTLAPVPDRAEKRAPEWDITVTDHERVDFFIEFLMGKNHDKTRQWLERMGTYGPMIRAELAARGMPQDLLYLAMIESGLNPNAYSRAHAAGMWQFIEETGQRYGLVVNRELDERRDPVKATAAALTYLQEMYDRFGSWYLAAAGYNTGENRVGRIMRERTGSERGADEDYWTIWDALPRETRDYVPLMLAMGHIAKDPAKYGFHGIEPLEPLQFDEVTVPPKTPLTEVARAAGADVDALKALNPHIRRDVTPSSAYAVRVPVGAAVQVAALIDGARDEGIQHIAE